MECEQQRERSRKTRSGRKKKPLSVAFAEMTVSHEICPICKMGEDDSEEGSQWICYDECDRWFHFDCLDIVDNVPDVFLCLECVKL